MHFIYSTVKIDFISIVSYMGERQRTPQSPVHKLTPPPNFAPGLQISLGGPVTKSPL